MVLWWELGFILSSCSKNHFLLSLWMLIHKPVQNPTTLDVFFYNLPSLREMCTPYDSYWAAAMLTHKFSMKQCIVAQEDESCIEPHLTSQDELNRVRDTCTIKSEIFQCFKFKDLVSSCQRWEKKQGKNDSFLRIDSFEQLIFLKNWMIPWFLTSERVYVITWSLNS